MQPLTIARLKRNSRVLGPGCRAIIWTHGCSKRCPHCIARDIHEAPPQATHTPATLYEWLKGIDGIEGVTLSGGDPFEQNIEALETFLRLVKNDPRQLSVMCYTGKLMAELQNDVRFANILKHIDILVDGPYVHELNDGHRWRGSSNQRIYSLNDKYTNIVHEAENCFDREIEIDLSADMRLQLTGIPHDGFMKDLARKLYERGYSLADCPDRRNV